MDYSIISNIGKRDNNEDYAQMSKKVIQGEEWYIFALADGLGGHGKGEVASKLVVETAIEVFENAEKRENLIADAFEEAQKRLLDKQKQEGTPNEMKTTMVLLLVCGRTFQWGHIGDSRLYFFNKNKLVTRTKDHSVPQMLVNAREIKESEIRKHPDRNRLLRVMGSEWSEKKYVISDQTEISGKESFLLCSDGFWENIIEKQMIKTLKRSKDSVDWLKHMDHIVQSAGKAEDMDNNTAITVRL